MTTIQIAILLSSLVHFLSEFPYIRNAYLGRSQPNRVTFLLWSVVPMIAFAAGLSEGATWALIPVFMSGFAPFLVFCASFTNQNAYWKLGRFDYACGALAIIAIILWLYFDNPVLAVIFAILADFMAGLPTQYKAWFFPETETGTGYIASFIGTVVGLFAVETWAFSEYGFLAFLFLANASLVLGVYHRNPIAKLKAEFAR